MEKRDSYPYPTKWRFLYRAAIFETDNHKKLKRISDAEEAILQRMRETLYETGTDVAGEREAMDDAMYALRAWTSALENTTHAA
jgi:hypothetical protein